MKDVRESAPLQGTRKGAFIIPRMRLPYHGRASPTIRSMVVAPLAGARVHYDKKEQTDAELYAYSNQPGLPILQDSTL